MSSVRVNFETSGLLFAKLKSGLRFGTFDPARLTNRLSLRINAGLAPAKEKACPKAREMLGKEFPIGEKPQLPLPDCPYPHQCVCYYAKFFDRRKAERRSGEERRQGGHRYESNSRRSGKDRRQKKSNIDWS